MDITRSSFKKNYLKNIILRLDFNGVMDPEMENIVALAKPFLKSNAFNRYDEKINNEVDFEINNNIGFSQENIVKDVRKFKIYSFMNDENGYTLEISKNCVLLKINTLKYIPFEDYEMIFLKIVDIYNSNIDYFTPKRLGLRKINFCFMKEISDLNKYFKESYFENSEVVTNSKNLTVEKRKCLQLQENGIKMNVTTAIHRGVVKEEELSKITLDLDVYLDNRNVISEVLFSEKSVAKLNNSIFLVYKDAMTEKLCEYLMNDELDNNTIEGIVPNE